MNRKVLLSAIICLMVLVIEVVLVVVIYMKIGNNDCLNNIVNALFLPRLFQGEEMLFQALMKEINKCE